MATIAPDVRSREAGPYCWLQLRATPPGATEQRTCTCNPVLTTVSLSIIVLFVDSVCSSSQLSSALDGSAVVRSASGASSTVYISHNLPEVHIY